MELEEMRKTDSEDLTCTTICSFQASTEDELKRRIKSDCGILIHCFSQRAREREGQKDQERAEREGDRGSTPVIIS
eukprot:2490855-Rhodomonas_salina.1